MKFWIHTYGCQMNERDSEAVGVLLRRHGHTEAAREAEADLLIVNTCSVREKAEDKAIGKLGMLVATHKADGAGTIVGAMGCMVERLQAALFARVPGLDFAVGTHRFSRVPDAVAGARAGARILDVGGEEACPGALTGHVAGRPSAFVNILFGCDRRCTYCIVPRVRGREWSRPGRDVTEEACEVVAAGAREIVLLGQSVMSYGSRNEVWADGPVSPRGFREPLTRLLEALSTIEGIERIRFASGHPSGCTPELIRAMAELGPVCEHLHLPVQSGSDRILKRMRRGYTTAVYRAAVARLRKALPGIALTTDVLVGFPSETVEEFDRTRGLLDEVGFDNAFIFKYSPRPGTPAAQWADDVPPAEKRRRNRVLLEDQERRGLRINKDHVGRGVEVLAEGASPRNPARWSGRTRTNKIVVFEPRPGVTAGDLVRVRVERARAQTLYGQIETAGEPRSK